MHSSDLPDNVLAAIERRVKRRIRRHLILLGLTLLLLASQAAIPGWPAAPVFALILWAAYVVWYLYQTMVDSGVRREIEREHQRRLQLIREGARSKREDRAVRLAGLADEHDTLLADDGELWIEDDLPSELKPKRRLDA
jgi:hypothetical protein